MHRESFVFYGSFYEAIKVFPRDVQGDIYTAIMEYGLYGNEPENLKPIALGIFTLVKPQLDANYVKYKNGCKGGAPKGSRNNPNGRRGNSTNPELTSNKPQTNPEQTTNKPNVNDNDNVNADVNENENTYVDTYSTYSTYFDNCGEDGSCEESPGEEGLGGEGLGKECSGEKGLGGRKTAVTRSTSRPTQKSAPQSTSRTTQESTQQSTSRPTPKSAPPELTEFREYFRTKGYTEAAADKAYNYYAAGGWKDSNGRPVKNWKQKCIAVWFKPENEIKTATSQYPIPV